MEACSDGGGRALDRYSGTSSMNSCGSSGKDRHVFYGFGLTIPNNAKVLGIAVRADAWAYSNSAYPRLCVELSWDGGSNWTVAKDVSLSITESIFTIGGPGDTWGRAWSPSQANSNNLRVRITSSDGNTDQHFYLDYIAVNVTYAP
jgi:hypothetical protein